MEEESTVKTSKLVAIHPWAEKLFLCTLLMGLSMDYAGMEVMSLLQISLGGLAVVYFMGAYMPAAVVPTEDSPAGFGVLLGSVILPKVLWMSSGISVGAAALYTINSENGGVASMAATGGSTILLALVILVIIAIGDIKQVKPTIAVVLRALPCLVLDYLLFFGW